MQQDEIASSVKERAKVKIERDIGAELLRVLNDPKTVELMLNADGKVWIEQLGHKMQQIGTLRAAQAQAVIETIAGFHGKEITRSQPILEGEFPLDGSRFAGQLPPIVTAPTFAIRKKAVSIFSLEQYVENSVMTEAQRQIIVDAVTTHKNILVIGGTGSGKTTLVNAIINQMVINDPSERVVIIEDTGEIQCAAVNFVQYHTSMQVSMTDLLKVTLRMRPDRILVGEVRGAEALDLLDAWNTGHPGGAATLHANSAITALARLRSLITRNPAAPSDIEPLIGDVVDIVIHIARTSTGRCVHEILQISGYRDGQYVITSL